MNARPSMRARLWKHHPIRLTYTHVPIPPPTMIPSTDRTGFCVLLVALLALSPSHAQESDDLGTALERIGRKYADNYAQPVTDALGADLNGGLFRTADFGDTGLIPVIDVYVGVTAMGAFTAGSTNSFRLADEEIQTDEGRTLIIEYPDRDLPAAFGKNESPGTADIIDKQTGTKVDEVTLPGSLVNTPIAPLAVPQVGIGTVLGTDAQVRVLPERQISDYGAVSLVGVAVRHRVSQYVPLLPIDVAVQGAWQELTLSSSQQGEVVNASGWALNAQVSRGIPILPVTFYGGVQYEQFDVNVDYTFSTSAGNSTLTLDQTAANSTRALAGVSIELAVLRLNVDYAVGTNNTVTAGVGVTL